MSWLSPGSATPVQDIPGHPDHGSPPALSSSSSISQPSASLSTAQNWDFLQFTHGFSSREAQMGDGISFPLAVHTQNFPWTQISEFLHPSPAISQ